MIKIEKTDVFGWESAIRGMRNPLNSWSKSDSGYCEIICNEDEELPEYPEFEFKVGEADLKLMKSLSKAGPDHGKFLRYINVTLDINAPLYWWKEYDTYKVGTVANSCSTMHKVQAKEFTMDDFSCDHLDMLGYGECCNYIDSRWFLRDVIEHLNRAREEYIKYETLLKDKTLDQEDRKMYTALKKQYWWQMIQLLPSSYNQKRTVQLNYQVLKSMYFARRSHKLDEWHDFCDWCESLPYFKEICIQEGGANE